MDNWPRDYTAEFIRRGEIADRLAANPQERELARAYYKTHPVEWINDWCVTYDPRNKSPLPRLMPFHLFKRQEELVTFLQELVTQGESGLVEKCRDMGATWVCAAFSVWLWLFWEGTAVGWGSRKEDLVDKKGDMSAVFPKIRMIIDNIPGWMRPKGYNPTVHASFMRIINPENGSTITGEAGDNIGRGGRSTIFFKDESAHYERPELIEAALGDNTDVQVDISSVNGTANVFYKRRKAGVVWRPRVIIPKGKTRVFIMDWRDHPKKTQEWYDQRRAKWEAEAMLHVFKQEVDRDYSGAVPGVILQSDWVQACVDAHIHLGINPSGPRVAGQDVADDGGDKNALVARHGILCNYAEHWAGEAAEAAKQAVPDCIMLGVRELYYDSIGVGAGFKGQINTMKEMPNWPMYLQVYPWNAAAEVQDPESNIIPGDLKSPINKDQYANLKAQAWFRVRTRIYKTFRAVRYGDDIDPAEVISISSKIPRFNELCDELSQPVRKLTTDGKWMVDKKPKGATSPNLADAFVMCFNPVKEVTIFDAL